MIDDLVSQCLMAFPGITCLFCHVCQIQQLCRFPIRKIRCGNLEQIGSLRLVFQPADLDHCTGLFLKKVSRLFQHLCFRLPRPPDGLEGQLHAFIGQGRQRLFHIGNFHLHRRRSSFRCRFCTAGRKYQQHQQHPKDFSHYISSNGIAFRIL